MAATALLKAVGLGGVAAALLIGAYHGRHVLKHLNRLGLYVRAALALGVLVALVIGLGWLDVAVYVDRIAGAARLVSDVVSVVRSHL